MHRRSFLPALGAAIAAPVLRLKGEPQTRDFSALLSAASVPSFAMATVTGSDVSYLHQGVRRRGEPATVDQETVFQAASLTKPLFAFVFLSLVREGRVDLDRPASTLSCQTLRIRGAGPSQHDTS